MLIGHRVTMCIKRKMSELLFALILSLCVQTIDASSGNHRVKRLADIVCDAGTTNVKSPHYYRNNAEDWCASAVGILANDFYNLAYRQECQRWMGGPLPDSVAAVQLTYCFEFANKTVEYRMGICCQGTVTDLRCFTGINANSYYSSAAFDSMNYFINYESSLTSCHAGEVCQTRFIYYGSNGNIDNITMSKGCVSKADCDALVASGNCSYCEVPVPECASCCNASFCNYGFQDYGYLRPAVCPVYSYPCDSQPCQNDGYCLALYNSSIGDYYGFRCYCRLQWQGVVCAQRRSLCASNPCLNVGTCYDWTDVATGDYRCDCPKPYLGDRCEIHPNFTCNGTEKSYREVNRMNSVSSTCTELVATTVRPDCVSCSDYVRQVCDVVQSEASLRIPFEMTSCARGGYYTYTSYEQCCSNRSVCNSGMNPCLNGGTCYDWSDVTPGEYRCDCPPLYVGDRCEIQSNLTCGISDATYIIYDPYTTPYPTSGSFNCTVRAWESNGRPNSGATYYSNIVDQYCKYFLTRRSDGHVFVQGVDGQVKPDQIQFELKSCDHGKFYSRCQYHMCAPTCLSSPCQNGGYCVQLTYNRHVCKCTFGFNGDYCENKLSMCAVSGDPHYRTFDMKMFSYQGICKHNLASPCTQEPGLPYFQVFGRNENRDATGNVSYPFYVEIIYNRTTVRLTNSRSTAVGLPVNAMVNGVQVHIPYTGTDFRLFYNGPYAHYVASFGLSVDSDGDWSIIVNVPAVYNGKMCGLCGNNDNSPNNDLTLANGTFVGNIENGVNLFGDSYVVDDPEETNDEPANKPGTNRLCAAPRYTEPPCDSTTYQSHCGNMNKTTGAMSSCVKRLPPGVAAAYYGNCMLDACYSGGKSMCGSAKVFVEECAASGVPMPCSLWQPLFGCENRTSDLCPDGMIYTCSASACQPTCADPNAPDSCPLPNRDSCACPAGQLLHNGNCTSECPAGCVDSYQQLRPIGDKWNGSNCTTVTCVGCKQCEMGAETRVTTKCFQQQVCINNVCEAVRSASTLTTGTVQHSERATRAVEITTTPAPNEITTDAITAANQNRQITSLVVAMVIGYYTL